MCKYLYTSLQESRVVNRLNNTLKQLATVQYVRARSGLGVFHCICIISGGNGDEIRRKGRCSHTKLLLQHTLIKLYQIMKRAAPLTNNGLFSQGVYLSVIVPCQELFRLSLLWRNSRDFLFSLLFLGLQNCTCE